MEGSLKTVESWLPTEFNRNEFNKSELSSIFKSGFNFPTEFPYEFDSFGSTLSSPDESVVGSTETESSEDDDFLAGLTRRLAQKVTVKPEKKWAMAGSPESTLSGIGSWSVSSNGSPNGVLSPPTTPFGVKNDTWDLIYAAAGEVARLKMNSEVGNKLNDNNHGFGPIRSHNNHGGLKNQNIGFFSNQNSFPSMNQYYSQARNGQVLKPTCSPLFEKQQPKVCWPERPQPQPQPQQPRSHYQQQQIQNRNRAAAALAVSYENGVGRCAQPRPLGLPQSAWPALQVPANQHSQQQQPHSGSGMRAVFLSGSGVKKERAGTGVFLPRRYGNNNATESKKKSTCSTALLPPRVVQALNLTFEDMNIYGDSNNFPFAHDATMVARRNMVQLQAQQKRNFRLENVLNNHQHEARLPQEWTY